MSNWSGIRAIRTTQERRANCSMVDPDLEDTLFRGRRGMKQLPCLYEEIHRWAERSWKKHRRHQYREKKVSKP